MRLPGVMPKMKPFSETDFATRQQLTASDVSHLLNQLQSERFYGAVTLKFEAGQIVIIKKEQTLKPRDLSGQPRSELAKTTDE